MPGDLRTQGIILRRTNYGETDRILTFLTPEGKIAALAKGVRKEKSRLAGGIELFSLSDIVIHQGRGRLGTLTSAKMIRFYKGILSEMDRLELASSALKKLARAADHADNPEYFALLKQVLAGLDAGYPTLLVSVWFYLNLARATGEEINLFRDSRGEKLSPEKTYVWDLGEEVMVANPEGEIGATEIKLARLILSSRLSTVAQVEHIMDILSRIEVLSRKYAIM